MVRGSSGFLGPGQRDVEVGQDGALDAGEVVEDGAGWGVGQVQVLEGGQRGAGGGDGGASFGEDAGQGYAGAEADAALGLAQPEDHQGDADDRDEGLDPVIVVQEDGPDPESLLEVTVALLDDPLVLVDLQDIQRGQRPAVVVVGQVGGQGIQPVQGRGRGDRGSVAMPADDELAGAGAGGDGQQAGGPAGEGLGDSGVGLLSGLVVAAAQPVAHPGQRGLGLG